MDLCHIKRSLVTGRQRSDLNFLESAWEKVKQEKTLTSCKSTEADL